MKGPRARVQPRPVASKKSSDSEAENKSTTKQPGNYFIKLVIFCIQVIVYFVAARKLTRSSSARMRKSKHVLGKNVSDSESESEAGATAAAATNTSKTSGTSSALPSGKRKPTLSKGKASSATASSSSSGRKKTDPKESASSYSGGSAPSSQEGRSSPLLEERKCPMAGCDSTGHLNGKNERHISLQGCPSYHNLTMAECASLAQKAESQLNHWSSITTSKKKTLIHIISIDLKKQNLFCTDRQEFHVRTPRSPRPSGPTAEQTKEVQKLRQARLVKSDRKDFATSVPAPEMEDENAEDKWREREPNLTGLTSEYDLALFRASQAEASSKCVSQDSYNNEKFNNSKNKSLILLITGRRNEESTCIRWFTSH